MRTARLALVVLVALTSGAHAAGRGRRQARQVPGWRRLAYYLPGAFAYVDRLALSNEQKKVLDETYKDWSGKWRSAATEAAKGLPALSQQDRKDPRKVRAYRQKRWLVWQKSQPTPPVELVSDVLTPEQLGKVLAANQVVAGWNKWLKEHLPAYEKRLDEILGAKPDDVAPGEERAYRNLEDYLPGAALLGRLGIGDKEKAKLQAMGRRQTADYGRVVGPLGPALRAATLSNDETYAVRHAVERKRWPDVKQARAAEIEALLTEEQKAKLSKALAVAKERDAAVAERYKQYVAELEKLLVRPKPKPKPKPATAEPARG